jgi:hypothetical protein
MQQQGTKTNSKEQNTRLEREENSTSVRQVINGLLWNSEVHHPAHHSQSLSMFWATPQHVSFKTHFYIILPSRFPRSSCYLLLCLRILWPCIWRQSGPSKCRCTYTLHGVTPHKTVLITATAVRPSNLTPNLHSFLNMLEKYSNSSKNRQNNISHIILHVLDAD